VTAEQVRNFLSEWQADLVKDGNEFAFDPHIQVGEYNPDWGSPVFYVP
jgi:hypothetical protein